MISRLLEMGFLVRLQHHAAFISSNSDGFSLIQLHPVLKGLAGFPDLGIRLYYVAREENVREGRIACRKQQSTTSVENICVETNVYVLKLLEPLSLICCFLSSPEQPHLPT
jgi:hypothetical protein